MSEHSGETTILKVGTFVGGGRAVEAGHGWTWFTDGWQVFKKAPGLWIGMILALLVLFVVVSLIPFLGWIAPYVVMPVFGAGMMIVCRKIDVNEPPLFSDLFAAFRGPAASRLLAVGAIYAAVTVVLVFVVGFSIMAAGGTHASSDLFRGGQAGSGDTVGAMMSMVFFVLILLALQLPLFMALWFAAPLVLFHEMSAINAMKASFSGCLRNIVPFLLYGVIGMVLAVVASIPFGLGWLVLAPVFVATIYTGYKDIYLS